MQTLAVGREEAVVLIFGAVFNIKKMLSQPEIQTPFKIVNRNKTNGLKSLKLLEKHGFEN